MKRLLPILVIASCLCATVGVDMAWGEGESRITFVSIQTSEGVMVQDAVLNVLEPGGQALSAEALLDGTFRVELPQKYGDKLILVVSSKALEASEEVFEITLPAAWSDVQVHLDSRTTQVTSARYGSPSISGSPQASSAAGAMMTRAVGGAIPTGGPPCGPDSITQSLDTATITPLNSVSCNAGGLHTDNSYVRAFTAADGLTNPFNVCSVTIAVETAAGAGGDQPIEVRLYNTADVGNLNAGTMIGSAPFTVLDGEAFFIDIPVVGTTITGELSVEIFTPEGQTEGNSFFIGSNPNGQTAPSYLAAEACGVTTPTDTAALGFPDMHIVMIVVGSGVPVVCGDGDCTGSEDCVTCPEDCDDGPGGDLCICGNGIVEEELGEECDPPDGTSCDDMCQAISGCGNGVCEGPVGGLCGDCDLPNPAGLPGCSDPVCEAIVCAADPFCCNTSWDSICADEAIQLCECVIPGEDCNSCPEDCGACPACECPAGGLEEGEECGTDNNGGCNSAPPAFVDALCGDTFCGTSWADGGTRDTDWYRVSHAGGPISASVISSLPTTLFVVSGICDCAPVVEGNIGCSQDCMPIQDGSADLPAGIYVIFVSVGDCAGGGIFEGFPCDSPVGNDYVVSITCDQGPVAVCGNGVVEGCEECDDGNTDPGDGCDENCLVEVASNCCPGGGNPGAGCDCPPCEFAVCSIDPFCCDVAWDGICEGEAQDLCDVCTTGICEGVECGDGVCEGDAGENSDNCPEDCFCGNGTVDPGEECEPPGTESCDADCMIIVTNDLCEDAIMVEVPSSTMGATIGAEIDPLPDACGTSVTSPGVWYKVIGTGNTMTATTCTDFFDYDTKITVLCQGCDVLTCIDGNDDSCPDGASGLLSTVTWCSQAGAEYLILVHAFGGQTGVFQLEVFDDGMPCSGGVQCIVMGACCVDGACVGDTPEPECLEMGGVWFEDETCAGGFVGYVVEECANPYVDISGTGILVPAASDNDDGGEVVPLGFTFNFYGDDHGDIGVASNGYLTFGPDLTDFSNDPIPTSFDPNDLIAPWWDDWNPSAMGDVYTQQFADPVRTMFQWTEMGHFGGDCCANYQAILFEDGAIELRYGDPLVLISPTVGVENQDGTDGTGVDPGMVGPGTCLRFTPLFEPGFDCAGACCQCEGPDQFCSVESLADCTALDGEFLGTGTVCEGAPGEPVTVTSEPNLGIPDDDAVGVSDTIDMGMSFNIIDLEVDLVINHTWLGDLCVKLSKDGGPQYTLIQRMNFDGGCVADDCCGCSSNDMDITLDDQAADLIEDACGASGGLLTGTFVPDEPLANFVGGDSAGAWTLTVNDNAGGDTGTLVSWSLVFAQPDAGGTSPCEEAFPDQCVVEQTLIIKQGACPAPVNPNSNGVIPMALVGDVDFDVSMVVLDSLQLHLCDGEGGIAPLNGPPGPKIQVGDINHPFDLEISCEEGPCACNEDQSSDGINDLLLKFSTDELMAAFGDALVPGAVVILELTGDMTEGPGFFARDCIQVVPPGGIMPANFAVEASTPRAYTELVPMDMNLDTDGFADFVRAYAPGETVTLTADQFAPDGTRFDHWIVNGVNWRRGIRTITVTATADMSLEAVYVGPQPSQGRPAPAGWNN